MQSEDDAAPPKTTEVQQLQPIAQAKAANKRGVLVALVAASLVVVAAAAGGGYLLWHRHRPAPPQSNPSQSTAAPVAAADWAVAGADSKPAPAAGAASQPAELAQNSNPTAAQAAPPATEGKPAAGVAATQVSPQAAAPAPRPQPPPVAFNPKKLDPKKNTRLKFDLGHFPASLAFTVEMDGKTFFKGHAASKADYDGLFVPPGVHEFRIEARAGAVQKASNTVTANFIAKKHMTLKVELRPLTKDKATAAANLNPAAQIVASLKTDFFSF
jgi:hypothetical protein